MRKAKRVVLLRSGNRMVISPSTPEVRDLVTPALRYVEKKFARGKELYRRKKHDLPVFDEIEWECFGEDHKGRVATSYGFHERIKAHLEKNGYEVVSKWATQTEADRDAERLKTVYLPRWDRIEQFLLDSRKKPDDPKSGFKFRYKQKTALKLMAEHPCGRIDCHTGWGKGTSIMLAAMLFPKAKIDVVSKSVEVIRTRLYPELAMNLPSVGIVGGGQKLKGRRVMCYTADSLHHARPDADFVFVDEGHQACADKFAENMGVYEHARVWMFSASWEMRLDNKDMRAEAMAGPIRLTVPYQKGVEHDIVVPMEVFWTNVIMDENPCAGMVGPTKKRHGIWTNEYRNKLIAKDAHLYDDSTQVLITVETLEHAMCLKELLPEFEVVYSGQGLKDTDIIWFQKNFPDTFRRMTDVRRQNLTRRFEKGKLKKAIATTVWNVGVDFRHLEVLIRGDAGGSPINDVQIPGRNSRFKRDADVKKGAREKFVGILHDYRDQFDSGFAQKAKRREGSYVKNGWAQHHPQKDRESLLRRMMNFGSLV